MRKPTIGFQASNRHHRHERRPRRSKLRKTSNKPVYRQRWTNTSLKPRSRFIGRAGMELVHAKWETIHRQSGNLMRAKTFVRLFAQCSSAIIAARREDPAAHLRACVALLIE